MIILGLTDSFTSGATLVADGEVVAAVSEERLDRNKMCTGFPNRSISEVLRITGIRPFDIGMVAVASNNLFWRPDCLPFKDYFRDSKGGGRDQLLSLGSTFSRVAGNSVLARKTYHSLKLVLTRERRSRIRSVLKDVHGVEAAVNFIDHHVCHAASAYYTSGFNQATVLTMDGAGDGKCSRVFRVDHGEFTQLHSLDSYDSIGNYYSYVTHLCGLKAHKHEGKITGLAAYGEPEYLELLERFVAWDGRSIRNTGKCFDHSAIHKLEQSLPEGFSKENLSASMQLLLEQAVSAYCDYWVRQSGACDLALAGGVFANVKLNQRIHEQPAVRRLFIHPGMGDEGLAVGAALFEHARQEGHEPGPVMRHAYLGAGYPDADIRAAIAACGQLQELSLAAGMADTVAAMLARGKVIARCTGPMEYGPRALGNRSILYQTTDATVNRWLNQRLQRTEYMPFAPVTLWEHRHACYRNLDDAEDSARFMTITFDCTALMREQSPAVVHIDGTARPQLIRRDDNPPYYDIVHAYWKRTGIPSLMNTSFNIHDEPIVNTPAEGIQAFLQSRLDALILGDHLLVRKTPAQ